MILSSPARSRNLSATQPTAPSPSFTRKALSATTGGGVDGGATGADGGAAHLDTRSLRLSPKA